MRVRFSRLLDDDVESKEKEGGRKNSAIRKKPRYAPFDHDYRLRQSGILFSARKTRSWAVSFPNMKRAPSLGMRLNGQGLER